VFLLLKTGLRSLNAGFLRDLYMSGNQKKNVKKLTIFIRLSIS